jgi:hypothetical protein
MTGPERSWRRRHQFPVGAREFLAAISGGHVRGAAHRAIKCCCDHGDTAISRRMAIRVNEQFEQVDVEHEH